MSANPFKQLQDMFPSPPMLPADVANKEGMTDEDKALLQKIGLTTAHIRTDMLADTKILYERQSIYQEVERAIEHWMVGTAAELYASYCTVYNPTHDATCWVTSDSPTIQRELTRLLDRICLEEKIFDWAYQVGTYGDMFVKINGIPGEGIISVDDSMHPVQVSRIDHDGNLLGFYRTPLGSPTSTIGLDQSGNENRLIAPWEYVHFRLLGGKKKRGMYGDLQQMTNRIPSLLNGSEAAQLTTKYGTSLLLNALPHYKRLRLAEDSLLLARLSRGLIRYIWKLKVDSQNSEAVGELIDQYSRTLREARALDTNQATANFESKENPMSVIDDIFLPVWDDVGDLTYDKIGGEADIKWIKDVEELRNHLAAALRTPMSLMGAYVEEASGSLGSQAIEKLDINFARAARKLQRAVINGIKRICQIHLAWMNMDPDPVLFEVHMPEMSTAEEESMRDSLDAGMEVVQKFMDTLDTVTGASSEDKGIDPIELDRVAIFQYLNDKFLKLGDFNIEDFIVATPDKTPDIEPAEFASADDYEESFEEEPAMEEELPDENDFEREPGTTDFGPECIRRKVQRALNERKRRVLKEANVGKKRAKSADHYAWLPVHMYDSKPDPKTGKLALNEQVDRKMKHVHWKTRCYESWNAKYGEALVTEDIEVANKWEADQKAILEAASAKKGK